MSSKSLRSKYWSPSPYLARGMTEAGVREMRPFAGGVLRGVPRTKEADLAATRDIATK